MTVNEAIVKVQGDGGYEMSEPAINAEAVSVDDWFGAQRAMEYGVTNVTADYAGIVRLPRGVTTDRGITYASLVIYPGDPATIYAIWEA